MVYKVGHHQLYKWSYSPYKWYWKWLTEAITPRSGDLTLPVLTPGRGPSCRCCNILCFYIFDRHLKCRKSPFPFQDLSLPDTATMRFGSLCQMAVRGSTVRKDRNLVVWIIKTALCPYQVMGGWLQWAILSIPVNKVNIYIYIHEFVNYVPTKLYDAPREFAVHP